MRTFLERVWKPLIDAFSMEWVLNYMDNGGAAIALRAFAVALELFLLAIAVTEWLDPAKSWTPSLLAFQTAVVSKVHWYGPLYGSAYAAFYARFASQWTYLANLYNQIKQVSSSREADPRQIAEWKAGFIEDAEYLHLAHKANFAAIIYFWCQEKAVRRAYECFSPGGKERLERLCIEISRRYTEVDAKRRGKVKPSGLPRNYSGVRTR
jgi:hypothetical protein